MATVLQQFVKDLQGQANAQVSDIARKLVSKKVASWEEYQYLTGKAAGLQELADVAYQLMKNKDLADDDSSLGEMPPGGPNDIQ